MLSNNNFRGGSVLRLYYHFTKTSHMIMLIKKRDIRCIQVGLYVKIICMPFLSYQYALYFNAFEVRQYSNSAHGLALEEHASS